MVLTNPIRYYEDDPFILGAKYSTKHGTTYGMYVGRVGNLFAMRTNQTDSAGCWLWNPVGCHEVDLIEDLVETFYNNL